MPWEFGSYADLDEASRCCAARSSPIAASTARRRGALQGDPPQNTPAGIRLLPENTPVAISVRDVQNRVVDERIVRVTPWSSAEWTLTLPAEGTLGNYSMRAIPRDRPPKPKTPEDRRPGDTPSPDDDDVPYVKVGHGSFLVAAYRRPDFRVDVSLDGRLARGRRPGEGRRDGALPVRRTMGKRPVTWRYSKSPLFGAPVIDHGKVRRRSLGVRRRVVRRSRPAGIGRHPRRRERRSRPRAICRSRSRPAAMPACRTSTRSRATSKTSRGSTSPTAPASRCTRRPGISASGSRRYFIEQKAGLKTELVAVRLDGTARAGVPMDVTLTQVQWTSVRRAEGNGFYTWETQRREVPSGILEGDERRRAGGARHPVPTGGYYVLEARGARRRGAATP